MASTPTPDAAVIAELPAITLALRQGGESACEAAAVQLHDIVVKAPSDTKNSVCIAIASNGEVIDAAFVQALGRPEISVSMQQALVSTMMSIYLTVHDFCNEPSSAMMQASPLFLPILLRIIAQEQPVSVCRYNSSPFPFQFIAPFSFQFIAPCPGRMFGLFPCLKSESQLWSHSIGWTFHFWKIRQGQHSKAPNWRTPRPCSRHRQ